MNRLLQSTLISSSLLFVSMGSFAAASSPSNAQLRAQMQKVNAEMHVLQKEVKGLRSQLNHQKHYKAVSTHGRRYHKSMYGRAEHRMRPDNVRRYLSGITVTTSPVMGLRTTASPADLLEQQPTMNEDLLLLQQQAAFIKHMHVRGVPFHRPVLVFSGGLEGSLFSSSSFANTPGVNVLGGTNNGVTLSHAEFDMHAIASSWASLFMSWEYDNAPAGLGVRQPNDRIYLRRGFLTIGNLNRFPVYFTIGQLYVPFGKYSSNMISTPVTESLARIRAQAAILGFSHAGFYAQVYGYAGNMGGANPIFKQGGANAGYQHHFAKDKSVDVGAGYVSNIADSEGRQT